METCNNHDSCMERINENMKNIEIKYAEMKGEIKGFTSSVNEFLLAIRKDIYSSDGLMIKSGKNANQINLHWGLILIVIVALVGGAIGVMFK